MHIFKFLQERIFGKPAVLTISGTSVKILQGRKALEYVLPKTFQKDNFLNHIEEMAVWLQAVLLEEKLQIRRCKIVLDSGQVYLQAVKLPAMSVEEQKNWIRWEGNQYIPFEPGTYQAVLSLWTYAADLRSIQENRVTVTSDVTVSLQSTEEVKLQDYLLIAIPLEIIEALRQFAAFLKANLEEVTALGPKQTVLPVNLLPVASGKEIILRRGYQAATVLCILMSMLLAIRGGICWYRTKSAWLEAARRLVPYSSVKTAYEENKKAEYQIRQYQTTLQHISRTEPVWTPALRTIGNMIPDGCWLEELQQQHTPTGRLEIKGCAIKLTRISEFLENLEQSGVFSKVRLVDSGSKRIGLKGRGDNSKKVVSFVLLAELASERKEARP